MGNTIETVRVYDGYVRVQNGFWHMDLSGRIYFQRCWFISDHREGILTEYKFWLPGIRTASRSDTLTHGKFIGLKRWQRTRWGLGVGWFTAEIGRGYAVCFLKRFRKSVDIGVSYQCGYLFDGVILFMEIFQCLFHLDLCDITGGSHAHGLLKKWNKIFFRQIDRICQFLNINGLIQVVIDIDQDGLKPCQRAVGRKIGTLYALLIFHFHNIR